MTLQLLQQKLPEIQLWIERTLAAHSARARPVASYHFPRLSRYYSNEILSNSGVVEVPRVPVLPLTVMGLQQFAEFEKGDYAGITYLNTYFVQAIAAAHESLHFHELVHVVQWQHLGSERFLLAYAIGYLVGGRYRDNPLEIMAYDFQERFENNASPFDAAVLIRRDLDRLVPALMARASKDEV